MISYVRAKTESDQLFQTEARSRAGAVDETTPPIISPAVETFASQLGGGPPQFVPVVTDGVGLFGYCSDGVVEKVRLAGGSIVFGWCIWEWPDVLLTGEFHSVWSDPSGALVDITPKPQRETRIVFVPDRSYPPTFDFDNRPANKRLRLYQPRDHSAEVDARIARMKPAQREYEEMRASKAGLKLSDWLLQKIPRDPLSDLVDEFIQVCDEVDALVDSVPGTGIITAPPGYLKLMKRKLGLLGVLKRIKRL